MKIYFSDFFNISKTVIEEYGAFNISLRNDLPLFVDPFLLFYSKKEEYKALHDGIIKYLVFLKEKSKLENSKLYSLIDFELDNNEYLKNYQE